MSEPQRTDRVMTEAALAVLGWLGGTVAETQEFFRACLAAMDEFEQTRTR